MLENFIKIFRLLLPKGRAWNIDLSNYFRKLIAGIMMSAVALRKFFLEIRYDVYPGTTRQIILWEEQFSISPVNNLTLNQRRDRLSARWAAQGGQSVSYMEQILLTLGIVAKIYENFNSYPWRCGQPNVTCGSSATCNSGTALNPKNFLELSDYAYTAGQTGATCGSDARCVNQIDISGDLLVNGFIPNKTYTISSNPEDWVFYWIMADPNDIYTRVNVPIEMQSVLKTTLLQIKPTHTRGILYVNYI